MFFPQEKKDLSRTQFFAKKLQMGRVESPIVIFETPA